ncbi:uncharacterized protein N7515_009011 [Penicillium bovifimosum]|uniref:RING-type E3 ubiquitin transferase n=1 Tax=Penicillium bovifimosum TaxID=126998 RepID=A0A9W9GIG5_9EURO|nr:uncharacterized protein N7515_009011 [Penicillium bovifimosum]KAJ5121050.1 hypothetical protein N7515_009011 [Penicillium bovifimosum]
MAGSSPPSMVPGTPSERPAAHGIIQSPSSDGGSPRQGPSSFRPGSERKRRLTTTSEDARQLERFGDTAGPVPDDGGASRSVLPHRSISSVLPSSRTRTSISAVPGSSFATAIDLSTSPPVPARSSTSGERASRNARQTNLPWINQPRSVSSIQDSVTPQFRVMAAPRWQADSEVSECPICGTVFNFWHRKHHCRKCGRVVCAACSPHRITIPRQYIVRPPEFVDLESSPITLPRSPPVVDLTADDLIPSSSLTANPALGGGEEVRLCNPCVPDPNPNPLGFTHVRPNAHRSTHSLSSPANNTYRVSSALNQTHEARQERHTLGAPDRPEFLDDMSRRRFASLTGMFGRRRSVPNREVPAETPSQTPSGPPSRPPAHHPPQTPSLPSAHHPPPTPSRPAPDEGEFCPVCRRQFPPLTSEHTLEYRQAHIRDCIEGYLNPAASAQSSDAQGALPLQAPSVTHMLPFVATEKDCLGQDGQAAECTICMEEYEVGQTLARLECLCKFHKHCIVEWFEVKRECPVHKLS